MGIMGFLRNRMGLIVVIVIGFALFAFIAGEVAHYGSSFFHGDSTELAEIAGEKVTFADFDKKLQDNTNNFKQQSRQTDMSPQITS